MADKSQHEAPVVAIEVWYWALRGPADRQRVLEATLTASEHVRAARFRDPADADAFVWARGGLRAILGQRLSRAPGGLEFATGPNGKPWLADGASVPHFNLSHSGGLAALAICDTHEVGIDIECLRSMDGEVAAHFFSPAEQSDLVQLPPAAWQRGFFDCWVRKEAVVKALGTGLSTDLRSFDVSLLPGQQPHLRRLDGDPLARQHWRLLELKPDPAYAAALACRTGGAPVALAERWWG
jgi:4'-phosphopantetheinyl transferase